ncbi:MAG TPA: hydrogenase maturation nickel metallochaperone HypA [Gemmataceae bacterium]|nr:hydrogenase maturation nickel metallochaperone HypA [Gemmataceae bacterium]
MHELSIALSILDLVEEEAERQRGRVAAVHLKLGRLSGVVKDALVSAYDMAREGTSLAQTELVIEEVPLLAHCSVCAADHPLVSIQDLRCPVCGNPTPDILSGRELEVYAIEVET